MKRPNLTFEQQQRLKAILEKEFSPFYASAIIASLTVIEEFRSPEQKFVINRYQKQITKALKELGKTESDAFKSN